MSFIDLPGTELVNQVTFPGLGLDFELNRVAFVLFGKNVYWYGVIIALGFLLAVLWCCRQAGKYGIGQDHILDVLIAAVPLCIVGARTYYVLFELDRFQKADGSLDWGEILSIRDGGIAIYGAVIAAALVVLGYCRWKKIEFLPFADLGVQGLLIGQLVGRWGNFVNVEAYGGVTDVVWRMSSPAIARELFRPTDAAYDAIMDGTLGVHPTFFYESMWNLLGFLLIVATARWFYRFDGQLFLSYVCWYGIGRAWIEGLRMDSLYFFDLELFGLPIRTSQVVAALSAFAAGWVLLYQLIVRRNRHLPLYAQRMAQEAQGQTTQEAAIKPIVMDGKVLATKVKEEMRRQSDKMSAKPGLAVIIVGDNPASRVYVNGKKKDCEECGFYSEEHALPAQTSMDELLCLIRQLNEREDIDGILVQLPLPKHLNEQEVLRTIRPDKDVDCFHPYNVGKLMIGGAGFLPCTPAGVMRMLKEYKVDVAGKHCVVVGRSNIVGKPQAMLMLREHATVTICHSRTPDLAEQCRKADILVAAVGKVGLITGDMVKDGAVVIDVAMNRNEQGKLCGDVVYDQVAPKCTHITPVPGGVGPMTRAMLMENTLYAAKVHGKK